MAGKECSRSVLTYMNESTIHPINIYMKVFTTRLNYLTLLLLLPIQDPAVSIVAVAAAGTGMAVVVALAISVHSIGGIVFYSICSLCSMVVLFCAPTSISCICSFA